MNYNVKLTWDGEASMWVATSDDVPGLVLESNSYDALIEKVKIKQQCNFKNNSICF